MAFESWDEVRTAYQVARLGTVSAAAEALGVHHATVIRHIDALERRLGARLFQRHARGYTATEAGRDLLRVAQATDDQLSQLANRIRGQSDTVMGELVVTSITGISHLLTPVFESFQEAFPAVMIRYLTDVRLFRLEYGEAHVAIRAGAAPEEPDNVAQPLWRLKSALYAARRYADRHGLPRGPEDFGHHRFVGGDPEGQRAPFHRWLRERVPPENFTFRASDQASMEEAVRQGLGIGFLGAGAQGRDPELIEVMAPLTEWEAQLWLVTHVDLHRSTKVQAFMAHIKDAARGWSRL